MPFQLRPGQWVVVKGRVGIVYEVGPDASRIDYVDDSGSTVDTQIEPNGLIERATEDEVPQVRRTFTEGARQAGASEYRPLGSGPVSGAVTEGPKS